MAWEERISKKIITWACWPQLGVPQWDPASQSCRWLSKGWNWPWKQRCPPQWQTGARGGLSYLTWEVIFAPQIRFALEVYKIWTHTQKKNNNKNPNTTKHPKTYLERSGKILKNIKIFRHQCCFSEGQCKQHAFLEDISAPVSDNEVNMEHSHHVVTAIMGLYSSRRKLGSSKTVPYKECKGCFLLPSWCVISDNTLQIAL